MFFLFFKLPANRRVSLAQLLVIIAVLQLMICMTLMAFSSFTGVVAWWSFSNHAPFLTFTQSVAPTVTSSIFSLLNMIACFFIIKGARACQSDDIDNVADGQRLLSNALYFYGTVAFFGFFGIIIVHGTSARNVKHLPKVVDHAFRKRYRKDAPFTASVHRYHQSAKCCGIDNLLYWRELRNKTFGWLPFSCCDAQFPGRCNFILFDQDKCLAGKDTILEQNAKTCGFYGIGCIARIKEFLRDYYQPLVILWTFVVLCTVMLLFPIRYLQTSCWFASERLDNLDSDEVIGYLFAFGELTKDTQQPEDKGMAKNEKALRKLAKGEKLVSALSNGVSIDQMNFSTAEAATERTETEVTSHHEPCPSMVLSGALKIRSGIDSFEGTVPISTAISAESINHRLSETDSHDGAMENRRSSGKGRKSYFRRREGRSSLSEKKRNDKKRAKIQAPDYSTHWPASEAMSSLLALSKFRRKRRTSHQTDTTLDRISAPYQSAIDPHNPSSEFGLSVTSPSLLPLHRTSRVPDSVIDSENKQTHLSYVGH